MNAFPIHTLASAPPPARASLMALDRAFGMLPNIAGAMAHSPVLIDSLVGLFGRVHGGSFDERQIQAVLLTDAVANASPWPVAFHTALALRQGVDAADVEAIRDGRLPSDAKLAALSALARALIEKRGHLEQQQIDAFVDAGLGSDQLLEVIAIVAASVITNYTASVTRPPLEDAFRQHAWARH